MQIDTINSAKQNCQNQTSFQGKHINEKSFLESSKNVRRAVRMLSIPDKGQVLSDVDRMAINKDIYISGYPKNSRQNGCVSLLVTKDGEKKVDYYFDAKGYKNASSLKISLLDALKRLSGAL